MTTEIEKDILELEAVLEKAERQTVKNILTAEVEKLRTSFKLQKQMEAEQTPKPVSGTAGTVQTELVFDPINSYSWDQTGTWVKVYVSLNGVGALPKENVSCTFEENSFNLAVKGLNRKNLRLALGPLNGDMLVEKSTIMVKTDMVIVKMKTEDSSKWSDLLVKKAPSGDEKQGGMPPGGMPGMGGMGGGMPGMGGMGGGMPGMGGMGGGMPGMGGMGGMEGMEGLQQMMSGMGGGGGMGGMGGMPGMGGMGGMPGMGGMGGMPGMPGMGGEEGGEGEPKDPQAGLMDMMKKMYDEGDDDMKKTINEAMAKAQDGKGQGPPA